MSGMPPRHSTIRTVDSPLKTFHLTSAGLISCGPSAVRRPVAIPYLPTRAPFRRSVIMSSAFGVVPCAGATKGPDDMATGGQAGGSLASDAPNIRPLAVSTLWRHFATWLGLMPRLEGTGGKVKLGPISKHGDGYPGGW
jgi:hypothetical protein